MEALKNGFGLPVHVGVEALMRVPVAPEKTGEPKHISVVRATDNNWAA